MVMMEVVELLRTIRELFFFHENSTEGVFTF